MSRWTGAALVTAVLAGLLQLVTIFGAPPAWACSCVPASEADDLRDADAVFAATVIDQRTYPSNRAEELTVTFDVKRVYKGIVEETARVASPGGGDPRVVSSCDVNYAATDRWLVYAINRGRDGLFAHYCGGTRPLPKELPAVLGAGHRPANFIPIPFIPEVHERGPVAWLAAGGLGLVLLAVPGWWVVRMRRRQALVADGTEARVRRVS